MSIFGRIFRPRKGKVARRETSSGSSAVRTGAVSLLVSSPAAMQVATVYRCVTLLSEKIASLEVRVSKRSGGLFVESPSDRLWYLLNVQPDSYLTAFDFWKQVVQHLLLQGNAYIVPVWDSAAMEWSRLALPNPVCVSHDTVNDLYTVNDLTAGICGVYPESTIIHLKNYSRDGKVGISTIAFARMTLDIVGTGDAETLNRFANGGNIRGLVSNDTSVRGFGEYQDKELEKTAVDIDGKFSGGQKIVSLPGQVQFTPLSLSSTDMQFLETRKFSVREICRFFGVHPSFVFDDTSNNYKITAHGYGVGLDEVWFNRPTVYVTKTDVRTRRWAFSVGAQISYGYTIHGASPYIGIGAGFGYTF
ncbi:MAG: phage portal protein [Bacteroidales bacterium]|nr:phage portal protein [Bacteroidales bacterium]